MLEIANKIKKECFALSGDDMKKFVTCMKKTQKKINKYDKTFNFGLIFISHKTQEFFSNDPKSTNKDYDEKFKPMFNHLFDSYFKNFN